MLRRLALSLVLLCCSPAAHAQTTGCVPNPNANPLTNSPPGFVNGCDVPASALNTLQLNKQLAAANNIPVIPTGNPLATMASFTIQGNSAGTLREFQTNLGMVVNNGLGVAEPNSDKVGLYVGIEAVAGAGDLWAINPVLWLNGAYNGSSAHHQVAEFDMENSGGYVDPRAGPTGIAYPTTPIVAPSGTATAQTSPASAVLTFSLTPAGVVAGMTVRDLSNPGAIAGGTYVQSTGASTVTMSGNAAGTVQIGDLIEFQALYTYGLVLESTGFTNTAAAVVAGSSQWLRGFGCDQTNAVANSCFFDYSTSANAVDIWGTHTIGVDLFNAAGLTYALRFPTGFGNLGLGVWLNQSAVDTSVELKSTASNQGDWLVQVVNAEAGGVRIYDNKNALEVARFIPNGGMYLAVPQTPGGKQPLCIDTGTNLVYHGNGGVC